jgi:hypothetical protein
VGALAALVGVGGFTGVGARGIYQNGLLAAPHVRALTDRGDAHDCQACHAPFRGPLSDRCADCHHDETGEGSTHPLGGAMKETIANRKTAAELGRARGTSKGTTALASFDELGELACFECHREHGGDDVGEALSPWKRKTAPQSIPPATCRQCHQDAHQEAPGSAAAAGGRVKEVRFDAFSHQDHEAQGVAQCEKCHVPNAQPAGPDFGPAGYTSCLPCHQTRKVPEQGFADHGRNARQSCGVCHTDVDQPKALQVVSEMPAALPAMKFGSQHHDRDMRCAECHADMRSDLPALSQGKPFDHYYHASSLTPDPAVDGAATAAAKQCAACHADTPAAASVQASKAVPELGGCKACHTQVEVVAGAPPPHPRAEARESVVFAHKDHIGKGRLGSPTLETVPAGRVLSTGAQRLNEQSCFACHSFASDTPKTGLPRIAAQAADCRGCHLVEGSVAHVDAGLQNCEYCHTGKESVYGRAPREERLQSRPGTQPYDHHLDTLDKEKVHEHATVECRECHGQVLQAETISELRFPDFQAESCQRCHGNLATSLGDLDCAGCHGFHRDPQTAHTRGR